MTSKLLTAFVVVLSLTTPAWAQVGSPGTAGAGNAAAASPGGVPPTMPGTGPGTTNPGQINAPEAPRSAPPTPTPNQVPETGAMLNSTRPAGAPSAAVSGSRTEGGTVGSSAPQQSQRDMDKALDDSTNKKIKDICKGC